MPCRTLIRMSERDTNTEILETDCEVDGAPSLLDNCNNWNAIDYLLPCATINQRCTSGKRKAVSDSNSSSSDSDGSEKSSPDQSDEESNGTEGENPAEQITSKCSSLSNEEQIAYDLENLFLDDTENNDEELSTFDDDVQKDFDGDTTLHIAFIFMAYSYIRHMLKSKTITRYINFQNDSFQTVLHLAVDKTIKAPVDIIHDLLLAGADPTIQDMNGRTFLHIICENCDDQTLPALCSIQQTEAHGCREAKAKVGQCLNMQNYEGLTALHIAATTCSVAIVNILLSLDADPNIRDRKSGRTALHFAAEAGYTDIVKILVNYPAVEIGKKTYNGESPLILAYHRKHDSTVQHLVNKGAVCNLHEVKPFGPVRQKFRKIMNL